MSIGVVEGLEPLMTIDDNRIVVRMRTGATDGLLLRHGRRVAFMTGRSAELAEHLDLAVRAPTWENAVSVIGRFVDAADPDEHLLHLIEMHGDRVRLIVRGRIDVDVNTVSGVETVSAESEPRWVETDMTDVTELRAGPGRTVEPSNLVEGTTVACGYVIELETTPAAAPAPATRITETVTPSLSERDLQLLRRAQGLTPRPIRRPPTLDPADPAAVRAYGHQCPAGHLSPPHEETCVVCGLQIEDREIRRGVRPVIEYLQFDDGTTVELDRPTIIGADPPDPHLVNGAKARRVVLSSADRLLADAHAEIRLDGWAVELLDLGSESGCYVRPDRNGLTRTQAKPGQPIHLRSGDVIELGDRWAELLSHPPG